MRLFTFHLASILVCVLPNTTCLASLRISQPEDDQLVAFASEQIDRAAQAYRHSSQNWEIRFTAAHSLGEPESFRIEVDEGTITITAPDSAGLMYGGLEVAEEIRIGGMNAVDPDMQTPHMKMRGVKFNIPLDARTPSYSDMSDSAQLNMPHMWDFAFWKEYIDTLARYRYNYISLWSLHPFPSLVKVPDYPDIALDNVMHSTLSRKSHFTGNHAEFDELYPTTGHRMDDPKILENLKNIRSLTIDEKIAFWQEVMAYGKSRNIDFYIITWNIFTYGTEGKYGIDDRIENPVTTDYFRKSVKELILTYPDLKGIGITTGENMHGASSDQKENWVFDTYGKGILDALEEQPNRKIRFIHRQHQASAEDIAAIFKPLLDKPNIDFIFSFKYAQAHVYSETKQAFHKGFLEQIGDIKTIWTLRNDDVYQFRWGAPDFVREFIRNIPMDATQGIYFGSDQYVWGREFLEKNPTFGHGGTRQLEIDKHWYQWALWGRLSYNPDIDNLRFTQLLATRFPESDAATLFDAWQAASMVYPIVTGFHWGRLDFQWYIEGSKSRSGPAQTPNGFHDLNRFISLSPHPESPYQSIPDFVQQQTSPIPKANGEQLDPLATAKLLKSKTDKALELVATLEPTQNTELQKTIEDIRIISYLGKYYAAKIEAATHLEFFRNTGNRESLQKARSAAIASAENWQTFTSIATTHYRNPIWLNRVGYVDWRDTFDDVLQDIANLGAKPELAPSIPTPGGTLLEAEDANLAGASIETQHKHFTGSGYARPYSESRPNIEWTFDAKTDGDYVLEIRYATTWWSGFTQLPLFVNEREQGNFRYHRTGSAESWTSDRIQVRLHKGSNTIRLQLNRSLVVDHLNVVKAPYSSKFIREQAN